VTTVLLADDHPLVRQGLRAVLDGAEGLAVAGEASDGDEVVRLASELAPDVVVMDLQMPGLHGIEATRRILAARPGTAVLVLTMFEDDDTVFAAVTAGACGYLLKGADGADIVTAIRSAAAGQAVFGAALAGRLSRWLAGRPAPAQLPFPQLTERERAILDGVAAGLTKRADRAGAVPVPEDGRQQRLDDPQQAPGRRAGAGHRAGAGGRSRPERLGACGS
jgi:DNA-binding NarL/FixJ family response regulator